jgi:hypothetical protein
MGAFIWLVAIGLGIFAQQAKGRNGWAWGGGTMFLCSIGNVYIDAVGGSSLYWECFVFGAAALLLLGQPTQNANVESDADVTRRCPFCAEDIKSEAVICKHCGSDTSNK